MKKPPIPSGKAKAAPLMKTAVARHRSGNLDGAERLYREILSHVPDHPDALHLSGVVAYQRGRFQAAVDLIQRAVAVNPNNSTYFNNLGSALQEAGRAEEAITSYRRAVTLRPDNPEAFSNAGNVYRDQDMSDQAIDCYRKALAVDPMHPDANMGLGGVFKERGDVPEALIHLERSLTGNPENWKAADNLLLISHYDPAKTPEEIKAAHDRWHDRFARPISEKRPPRHRPRSPEKRLRIGFVSTDFCRHPVGYLFMPFLRHRDRDAFEVFCYHDHHLGDEMTRRMRGLADGWRITQGMDDEGVDRMVRGDGIDILVDLSGHTAGNRLLVFARKPAPLQISWLGYPDTTGLRTMDGFITDKQASPPGSGRWFSESLIRMPGCYLCYEPPNHLPPVSPSPAGRDGRFTFASLNNPAKITEEMVDLWAEILRKTPHSRLLLKYRSLDDEGVRSRFRDRFERRGIERSRLDFRGLSDSHEEHLAVFSEIDVSLDTYPYNGTATTLESLYMGVPVISLAGRTFVRRQGVTLLTAAGYGRWVVKDRKAYVGKALSLASNIDGLTRLRREMREKVAGSVLCDGPGFTNNLAAVLRELWDACNTRRTTRERKILNIGFGPKTTVASSDFSVEHSLRPVQLNRPADTHITAETLFQRMAEIPDGSFEAVDVGHGLERFFPHQVRRLLGEIRRILKPEGTILASAMDLQRIARHICSGRLDAPMGQAFQGKLTPLCLMFKGHTRFQGASGPESAPRTGYTKTTLEMALARSGFQDVRIEGGKDYTLSAVARKPSGPPA